MNIIKLMGGIGNQLFQYAFGQQMLANGIDVAYDTTWYKRPHIPPRSLQLEKFNICPCIKFMEYKKQPTIKEKGIYNIDLLRVTNNNFEGYWQCYPYFKRILPLLKKELVLKEEYKNAEYKALEDIIKNDDNSISVHIRRGDYLKQTGWKDLPFIYYMNVIGDLEGNLYIFSDDIPWCKEKFNPKYYNRKIQFIQLNDYLDFELMRLCKHHIIPNSTFSYWTALLSEKEGTTFCPKHWLGEKEPDVDEMHYPKEWIKMEDFV